MNIIEAVKSGKRFRRAGWPDFLEIKDDGFYLINNGYLYAPYHLGKENILATDWEVEEPEPEKITVTAEEVREAIFGSVLFAEFRDDISNSKQLIYGILKELGFKEI